jgi:hypothetical protein
MKRTYQPGQVYTTFDMGHLDLRMVLMLVRRLEVDEDFEDGWGNKGGRTAFGWYWYSVNLLTGAECVTIDYTLDHWDRLA